MTYRLRPFFAALTFAASLLPLVAFAQTEATLVAVSGEVISSNETVSVTGATPQVH